MDTRQYELEPFTKSETNTPFRAFLFFCISPVLGFVYALMHIKEKVSFVIFFLFSIVWGLSFSVPSVRGDGVNVDGSTYRNFFEDIASVNDWKYWYGGLISFINLEGEYKDYYMETLSFIGASIVNNYHVMFMMAAIIFSYFQLKNLKFLVLEKNFELCFATICLLYMFNGFNVMGLNALRFPTASCIFQFVVLRYYILHDKRPLLILLFLPFFHGSFFFVVPLFFLLNYFKKYYHFWLYLFFVGIVFSTFFQFIIPYIERFVPSFLYHYVEHEVGEDAMSAYEEATFSRSSGLINMLFAMIGSIYSNMLVLILLYQSRKCKLGDNMNSLFLFYISFMSLSTIIGFIPYASGRFRGMLVPLFVVLWVHIINRDNKINRILYLFPLFDAYNLVMTGYLYFRLTNPFFWFMPPVFTIPYMLFGDV